jgi:glutathionylspermidine synthase
MYIKNVTELNEKYVFVGGERIKAAKDLVCEIYENASNKAKEYNSIYEELRPVYCNLIFQSDKQKEIMNTASQKWEETKNIRYLHEMRSAEDTRAEYLNKASGAWEMIEKISKMQQKYKAIANQAYNVMLKRKWI